MQAVLEALRAPMEACVDFALKYTKEGQQGALLAALPLWEEAVEAIREQQKGAATRLLALRRRSAAVAAEDSRSSATTLRHCGHAVHRCFAG